MTTTLTHPDRPDLLDRLAELNAEARALSRRGHVGTRSQRYAVVHASLDVLLHTIDTDCLPHGTHDAMRQSGDVQALT